jgi:hypothetical protein
MVATGMTFAPCLLRRCLADFETFLLALFASYTCQWLNVLHRILDNGSMHAPKQKQAGLNRSICSLKCASIGYPRIPVGQIK